MSGSSLAVFAERQGEVSPAMVAQATLREAGLIAEHADAAQAIIELLLKAAHERDELQAVCRAEYQFVGGSGGVMVTVLLFISPCQFVLGEAESVELFSGLVTAFADAATKLQSGRAVSALRSVWRYNADLAGVGSD